MGAIEHLLVPRPDEAEALYKEHGEALRAFVLARVRNAAAAEDICQETFLAALARGVPLAPEEASRWLYAIAKNKILRFHRDSRREAPKAAGANSEEPTGALEDQEERARVRAAVSALEPELREVILLRYEAGLDYKEVAERLGVPVSTVQGRLKRARIALRGALLDERDA
jgi:RNA polymerase sigma-70 factor (ECF subfamily)